MIAIIDYGAGNIQSVYKALRHIGCDCFITNKKDEIMSADGAILPGVGSFGDTVDNMEKLGIREAVKEFIASGKPFLGICLGLQLLFPASEESPEADGLNIFAGSIRKIPKKEGLKIGDKLTIELEEYDDDMIGKHTVQREFIITGFFDIMEGGESVAIAGKQYSGAYETTTRLTDLWLECPESEKTGYIEKLRAQYGSDVIKTKKEAMSDSFGYIIGTINALKIILSIMIAFILSLNTTLYMTVDLVRETPGVAMLKCVGFSNSDIRKWQMIRMLLIIIVAYILGVIGEYTLVDSFAGSVFGTFGVTRFHFVPAVLDGLVIVPVIVLGIGLVAMRVCLIKVKGINLWNIRED